LFSRKKCNILGCEHSFVLQQKSVPLPIFRGKEISHSFKQRDTAVACPEYAGAALLIGCSSPNVFISVLMPPEKRKYQLPGKYAYKQRFQS
jgi:hypothetical protein